MAGLPPYLRVLSVVLLASVLIWFGLLSILYRRLAENHPEKYRQMGQPEVLRSSPRRGRTLLKFIFAREDRQLNDPRLSLLTTIMLVFFICYSIVLVFSMIEVLLMTPVLQGS
jgi:hypothetical protein